MKQFNENDIEFLLLKGFVLNNNGFCGINIEGKDIFVVPQDDNYIKLELYEWLDDGDGNMYQDYNKIYSEYNQTLKSFIEEYL